MHEDYPQRTTLRTSSLIIFDKDTDDTNADPLLGYRDDALSTDDELKRQVRTATDYLGLYSFLRSLGFGKVESHQILEPRGADIRVFNPNTAYDGIVTPVVLLTLGTTGRFSSAVPATSVCSVMHLSGQVSSTTPRHCLSTSVT